MPSYRLQTLLFTLLCPVTLLCARDELPLMDPIPEPVGWGDLSLHLEPWLRAPATAPSPPRARINSMKPAPDGSGRLFLNDLRGPLYVIEDGKLSPYLDLSKRLPRFYDERGLGGGFNFYAFHPEFKTNGLLYTIHSEEPGSETPDFSGPDRSGRNHIDCVILEWKTNDPRASTFEGAFRKLMRIRFPIHIHFVQDMEFNPSARPGDEDYGLLYIGVGEGGAMKAGQADYLNRLDSIWGTVIRIDPQGTNSANGQYGIPPTNPWASDGDHTTLGELWAIGFRNPHRFAWDSAGRLFVSDIGEMNVEELNLVEKGLNYGWPHREGTFAFQLDPNKFALLPLPEDDQGYTYPVAQFDHRDANAICGGYFYQGKAHPLLQGKYVFGAIVHGHLFYVDASELAQGKQALIKKFRVFSKGSETTMAKLAQSGRVDLRLGVDHEGELYVFEKSQGQIFKISEVTHSPTPR